MAARNSITVERLRELLHYDPETGIFLWRVKPRQSVHVGDIAGGTRVDGYIAIKIQDRSYFAHRLAWLWMTGKWPAAEIDHRNRTRNDNRWLNLRIATSKQNNENQSLRKDNRSGVTGVGWDNKSHKWRARIRHNDQLINLGYFDDFSEAVVVRRNAERRFFTHADRR